MHHEPTAAAGLAGALREMLDRARPDREVVVVCIGTDRSTGDSLGPLTGLELVSRGYPPELVFGTLDDPVHAGNLPETIANLNRRKPGALVLAVDACLGNPENVGSISLSDGPLRPGAGVNKTLPQVGELALTGVVNVAGFMEYFVLQNTRLSLVLRMARVIATAILDAVRPVRLPVAVAFGKQGNPSQEDDPSQSCPGLCSRKIAVTDSSLT